MLNSEMNCEKTGIKTTISPEICCRITWRTVRAQLYKCR